VTISVVSPRSLAAALSALEHANAESRALAGGTDLMVEFATGRTRPDFVVDVWRVDELRGIRDERSGVRIGALSTCRDLLASQIVRERADLLALAADEVGAEQIKNRATLGGNLGTASPASDLGPVLFALDARVRLVSSRGARELSIDEFWTGYRKTARAADELIESVLIPARAPGERRGFRKVGTRRAQSISKVVVAAAVQLENGLIRSVRAAAGSVAERTLRLPTLERELAGARPSAELFERVTRLSAARDIRPIDDVRSSASYRTHVFQRITRTLLAQLCGVEGAA
jgi:CO/xanthine dehydrogenase FAD-binding subunit